MDDHFTRKYFKAFPFSQFSAVDDPDEFLYNYQLDGKKYLYRFDAKKNRSLKDGERLVNVDFNKQCCWPIKLIENKLYLISDKDNEENLNIFVVDLTSKNIEQLTYNDYTCCVHISDDEIAYYSSRKINDKGLFESEIRKHNLQTGEIETLFNDNEDEYRVGWGKVRASKDQKSILINVDLNNERKNLNYCLVDIATKQKTILIPKKYESSVFYMVGDIVDTEQGIYFVSDCEGYENLYYYSFQNNLVKKLSNVEYLTQGFGSLNSNGHQYFYHTKISASEGITELILAIEDAPGELTFLKETLRFEGEVEVFSSTKDFVWVGNATLSRVPERIMYKLKDSKFEEEHRFPFMLESNEQLVHSTHEYIKYPSFDELKIPSYLVIPKGEIKGAIITSFYGGDNYYNTNYQIMAELGFVSMSPAVRGSWGHGRDWEEMLKGDLGGNEILDVLWAAKFLEEKFDLKPSQIGVEGGSHGGYSTLRALTLPPNFKGQDSKYPFGFGICWAGFADLVDFYKTSNIPDWLANMLGPFEENEELYKERSPINFFKELSSPLFITHGTKDSRVPPSTMDGFLDQLRNSDIPHYIYLMDGQGHTGGSEDERVDELKTMFDFLEKTTQLGWK